METIDRPAIPTGLAAVMQLGEGVHWEVRRQDGGTFRPFLEARAYADGVEVARIEIDDKSALELIDTMVGELR